MNYASLLFYTVTSQSVRGAKPLCFIHLFIYFHFHATKEKREVADDEGTGSKRDPACDDRSIASASGNQWGGKRGGGLGGERLVTTVLKHSPGCNQKSHLPLSKNTLSPFQSLPFILPNSDRHYWHIYAPLCPKLFIKHNLS